MDSFNDVIPFTGYVLNVVVQIFSFIQMLSYRINYYLEYSKEIGFSYSFKLFAKADYL